MIGHARPGEAPLTFGIVGCHQCGQLWLAQFYIDCDGTLTCPSCTHPAGAIVDELTSLEEYVAKYGAGFLPLGATKH